MFPAWRRGGIATRACRLALAFAANELDCRIATIKVLEGNDASLAVARKLGAVATGTQTSEAGKVSVVLRLDLTPWR